MPRNPQKMWEKGVPLSEAVRKLIKELEKKYLKA